MFEHILVAVDGSAHANEAVPAAIEIAKKFNGDVFVLHVWERELGRGAAFPVETPDEAENVVNAVVKTVQQAGVSAKGEIQHAVAGHAAKHIVETASERGSNLIAMGTRGLSDIEGLLLGSVTHKVLQLAHVPVLVVRPKAEAETKMAATAGQRASTS